MTFSFTFRKSVPLIHQLSLGYPLSLDDQTKILPLLGSFVVLFRYTLFSIYDSDFYNEKAGEFNCALHTTPANCFVVISAFIPISFGIPLCRSYMILYVGTCRYVCMHEPLQGFITEVTRHCICKCADMCVCIARFYHRSYTTLYI